MLELLLNCFAAVIAGFILLNFEEYILDFLPDNKLKFNIVITIIFFILWSALRLLIVTLLY